MRKKKGTYSSHAVAFAEWVARKGLYRQHNTGKWFSFWGEFVGFSTGQIYRLWKQEVDKPENNLTSYE